MVVPGLDRLTVSDAMHRGVVTCSAGAGLAEVAEAMAEHGIHCVVAIDEGPPGQDDDRLWGVVSDLDLMRGLRSTMDLDAGNLADLDIVTVAPDDPLADAADAMLRHGVAHLVVVADGRPVGVLSTLDIARAVRSAGRTAGDYGSRGAAHTDARGGPSRNAAGVMYAFRTTAAKDAPPAVSPLRAIEMTPERI